MKTLVNYKIFKQIVLLISLKKIKQIHCECFRLPTFDSLNHHHLHCIISTFVWFRVWSNFATKIVQVLSFFFFFLFLSSFAQLNGDKQIFAFKSWSHGWIQRNEAFQEMDSLVDSFLCNCQCYCLHHHHVWKWLS